MKKIILWLVVIVVIVGIVTVYKKGNQVAIQNTNEPIKIGAVLGLTGYAATDSLSVQRGIDLAVEDLAKRGIVVDVNYQDDKTDPKDTVSAIKYLVSVYKPDAIVGPIWSFLEDAGTPTLTQSNVIAYAPADTSEYTTGGPYILHGAVKNEKIIPSVVSWLKEKGIKKVAIIVSKDGWGSSVEGAFKAAAAQAGAQVVLSDGVVYDQDVVGIINSDITKAKALKAEAFLFTGYDEGATILAKKRLELNYQVPVLGHTQVYGQLIDRGVVTKDQMKGIDVLEIPIDAKFAAKFKAKYGEAPSSYSDRAYDGIMLLVDAIQHAPAKDGATLTKYIRENTHYKGYAGLYEFDEKGDLKGGAWVIHPAI